MELDPRASYTGRVVLALAIVVLVGGGVGAATYVTVDENVRERQQSTLAGQALAQSNVLESILLNNVRTTRQFAVNIERATLGGISDKLAQQADSSGRIRRVLYVERDTGIVDDSSDDEFNGRELSSLGYTVPPMS